MGNLKEIVNKALLDANAIMAECFINNPHLLFKLVKPDKICITLFKDEPRSIKYIINNLDLFLKLYSELQPCSVHIKILVDNPLIVFDLIEAYNG